MGWFETQQVAKHVQDRSKRLYIRSIIVHQLVHYLVYAVKYQAYLTLTV